MSSPADAFALLEASYVVAAQTLSLTFSHPLAAGQSVGAGAVQIRVSNNLRFNAAGVTSASNVLTLSMPTSGGLNFGANVVSWPPAGSPVGVNFAAGIPIVGFANRALVVI